ncbi:hypothetical protein GOP47_0028641 [Adiantum capillus-veneris]|nr:hypothetical protein GOP47_0028641 [Adiantum capillus-veneris]
MEPSPVRLLLLPTALSSALGHPFGGSAPSSGATSYGSAILMPLHTLLPNSRLSPSSRWNSPYALNRASLRPCQSLFSPPLSSARSPTIRYPSTSRGHTLTLMQPCHPTDGTTLRHNRAQLPLALLFPLSALLALLALPNSIQMALLLHAILATFLLL